jgi:hypothetical protein
LRVSLFVLRIGITAHGVYKAVANVFAYARGRERVVSSSPVFRARGVKEA